MKRTLITEMIALRQLKIWDGRSVGNVRSNACAKFRWAHRIVVVSQSNRNCDIGFSRCIRSVVSTDARCTVQRQWTSVKACTQSRRRQELTRCDRCRERPEDAWQTAPAWRRSRGDREPTSLRSSCVIYASALPTASTSTCISEPLSRPHSD